MFSWRTIDVPSIFISGQSDGGVYQRPGAIERMQATACTRLVGGHLLDGAGPWVQQEHVPQPNRACPWAAGVPDRRSKATAMARFSRFHRMPLRKAAW